MSFMYKLKNNGSGAFPWRSPLFNINASDSVLFTSTLCLLSEMKLSVNQMLSSSNPIIFKFSN